MVEGGPGAQPAAGGVDREGRGVGAAEAVGEGVPVAVGGGHGVPDRAAGWGVLVDAASGAGRVERRGLLHVGHVDPHADGVGRGAVAGGDGQAVAAARFVVEGGPGPQLARGLDDAEGGGVGAAQRVGEVVAVVVAGLHGVADGSGRGCVLGHGAGGAGGGELRGGVDVRLGLDTVDRDRGDALARAVTVRVPGGGAQEVTDVAFDWRVAVGRGAANRLPATPGVRRALPCPRRRLHDVEVGQCRRERRLHLRLHRGEAEAPRFVDIRDTHRDLRDR